MNDYLEQVDAWEARLAAGEEIVLDCLGTLQTWIRVDTIQPIFDRLGERSKRHFLLRARLQQMTFDDLVKAAPSEGDNPETYFVIREWIYRQPFDWKHVPIGLLLRTDRGASSPVTRFEEVVPALDEHAIEVVVAGYRPGWRNGLRQFGRGLRPGLEVVCEVALAQGVVDPKAIRTFVRWAESTKLERTRWEAGE